MSKLLEAFTIVHGEMTGACYTEIEYDEYENREVAVKVMKGGNLCWKVTMEELAFELALHNYKTLQSCECCKCEKPKLETW